MTMIDNCNLCHDLHQKETNIKRENEPRNENEIMAHIEIHRRQLKLINGSNISSSELLVKCFPIKDTNPTSNLIENNNSLQKEK